MNTEPTSTNRPPEGNQGSETNKSFKEKMKRRTKAFAIAIIHLVENLPRTVTAQVIGKQLLRAGTSVAANYRAVCRAKSKSDFAYKLNVVEEEIDESLLWLELIDELKLTDSRELGRLIREAGELTAIFTSAGRTAKGRK